MTNRYSTKLVALAAALILGGAAVACAQNSPFVAKEADLIEVLKTGQKPQQALACKQLAIHGTEKAVPELARLLADAELSSWALIALEAIPGPAVDAALIKAVGSLEGRQLVGTINSIGVRRAEGAVETLTEKLADQDAEVASAAAVALGKIGSAAATKKLRESLAGGADEVRSAVAEGLILCAEQLLAGGEAEDAVAIYDEVRQADVVKPRKLEATRGAILARKSAGIPLLIEQLQSNDKQYVQIALSAARELPGSELEEALAAELTKIGSDRAALVLYALADRNLADVPAAVLQAAKTGEKPVRIAAIEFVGRLGDASSVATLLAIATENDAEISAAARQALADLPGKGVNAEIADRLTKSDDALLAVLIDVVGQRRIDATPPLIKALDHRNPAVRTAALKALGATIGPEELPVLIKQVVSPKDSQLIETAHQALTAACVRMPDRDACATELTTAMRSAPIDVQVKLLEVLGAMQGKKSLETIAASAKGNNEKLQDASSRLLGEWMSLDAAPVLLDLAKNPGKYQGRALRGYLRLARQFQKSDRERAEMCEKALEATRRTDEKILVLKVAEVYPSPDMLRVVVKASAVPALKEEANKVALVVAQKLGAPSADIQELLSKIGLEPVKVEIVKAVYGAGGQQKDVTEELAKHVGSTPLIALPKSAYNEAFGGDPAPNTKKSLRVQYRIDGKAGEATFDENATIILPMPK